MPMPQKFHSPDALDYANLLAAIGNDFGLDCRCEVYTRSDRLTVVARCRSYRDNPDGEVVYQSLVEAPYRNVPDVATLCYKAALDCWHQADNGGCVQGVQRVRVTWSGRPEVPRR